MRLQRTGFEFRMKLASQKPWMSRQFDDLHKISLRVLAANSHPLVLKHILKLRIEFIAVAVPFRYFFLLVYFISQGVFPQNTGIGPKSHIVAHIFDIFQFFQFQKYFVARQWIEFCRMGAF